ncbi:MAG: hypothetical protein NVSMB70_02640 [Chamaesiphon sp.]
MNTIEKEVKNIAIHHFCKSCKYLPLDRCKVFINFKETTEGYIKCSCIDCPKMQIADYLWQQKEILKENVRRFGLSEQISILLNGKKLSSI